MSERYVVSKVTGFPISGMQPTNGKKRTIWSVLDSAICYRPVSEYSHGGNQFQKKNTVYGEQGERNMRALADRLNAEDERRGQRCVTAGSTT